jgi:hypothetical protein
VPDSVLLTRLYLFSAEVFPMHRNSIFWGFILVLAGGLLLLSNLGILRADVWDLLWPLFLIALGAWVLWGTVFRRSVKGEDVTVSLEGAGRARVRTRHGAGQLVIGAGAEPGNVLQGTFGGGLNVDKRRDGDRLDVNLSVPPQFFPFSWGPGSLDWTFSLNRDIPFELDLETGASESRVDLTGLRISDVRLKSGASHTEITLPENAGFTRVDIETGVASVLLRIPSGVAARIRARGGLASINVDTARFPLMGDTYQSPDYDSASNKADLDIQTGVGSVDVR